MFDFFAGLVTGYVVTWYGLIILLLIGIFLEHAGSRKLAVMTGIGAMVVSYCYFDVDVKDMLVAVGVYLVIGVLWSFIRYRAYVKESVDYIKSLPEKYRRDRVSSLAPSNNLDQISGWIIIWPFSFVEHILSDIISAIKAIVTKVFKGVYHRIYTKLTAGLLDFPDSTSDAK